MCVRAVCATRASSAPTMAPSSCAGLSASDRCTLSFLCSLFWRWLLTQTDERWLSPQTDVPVGRDPRARDASAPSRVPARRAAERWRVGTPHGCRPVTLRRVRTHRGCGPVACPWPGTHCGCRTTGRWLSSRTPLRPRACRAACVRASVCAYIVYLIIRPHVGPMLLPAPGRDFA